MSEENPGVENSIDTKLVCVEVPLFVLHRWRKMLKSITEPVIIYDPDTDNLADEAIRQMKSLAILMDGELEKIIPSDFT